MTASARMPVHKADLPASDPEASDPLAPAKGIIVGLAASAVLWAAGSALWSALT